MQWTAEQQEVINTRGCNLAVSAAAGSGKTAVLVERICSLIVDGGADISRMLVATFTRAAAAEMKSRITARLTKAVAESAGSRRLGEQLLKVDRAQIGTLHSFCGELLRQYYALAGIEPSFKTEDESVTQLLYDEALEDTLDAFFEEGDADFLALAACWGGRDGGGLNDLTRRVYDAARNQPDPIGWLRGKAELFNFTDMNETPWRDELLRGAASDVALALECEGEALRLAERPGGPNVYAACMTSELEALEALQQAAARGDLETVRAMLSSNLFGRLPGLKNPQGELAELAERAKDLRDEAKMFIKRAQENPLISEPEEAARRTRAMLPQMRALARLAEDFDARYTAAKRYENVLDFSDLEHMALGVLGDPDALEETRGYFEHVFVDEYQDISPIQDELLRRVARPGAFFCVGDVKQSIYRFRSAEPEIFIRRLAGASETARAAERKISLSSNFRSASRVVRLANCLFSGLMTGALGGVDYVGGERLVLSSPQPPVALKDAPCELILLDGGGRREEELTPLEQLIRVEREATVAARKISELMGTRVWDGKLGAFRALKHSDITVLLRAVSNVAGPYAEVFRRAGIPVFAEAEGGFADELEVQLLVNLLRLVDNALRDWELLTSLRSVIGGFTLEDLTEIRGLYPNVSFAEAAQQLAREGGSELASRLAAFFEKLSLWREAAQHMNAEALIWRVCDDTGFLDWASTLAGGSRRQANVARLAALARGFNGSLYDFLKNFGRLAEAARGGASGQASGAVALMSVHKSKGLEFPMVILSNVGKRFNLMDASSDMLLHGELGLGPMYRNAERHTRADTLARAALSLRAKRETLSEEMRLLYVAVTRARERFIAIGSVDDLGASLARWALPMTPAGLSARARSWADWLGPVALRTPAGREAFGILDAALLPDAPEDFRVTVLDAARVKALRAEPSEKEITLQSVLEETEPPALPEALREALEWRYPWGDVAALPAKVSATSLLDRERNWRGPIPAPELKRLPRFMEEARAFSSADLGTFTHTALQLMPMDTLPLDIPMRLNEFERRGLIPEGAAAAIDAHWLERFFTSKIASRIRRSKRVERELPFNLAVPVHQVFPGETGGDDILIQGIIDCCFLEDDRWVLVDYKTNRVDDAHTEKGIAEHYRPQLQTYRSALEEITGIEVREAWLYLLAVGREVRVKV